MLWSRTERKNDACESSLLPERSHLSIALSVKSIILTYWAVGLLERLMKPHTAFYDREKIFMTEKRCRYICMLISSVLFHISTHGEKTIHNNTQSTLSKAPTHIAGNYWQQFIQMLNQIKFLIGCYRNIIPGFMMECVQVRLCWQVIGNLIRLSQKDSWSMKTPRSHTVITLSAKLWSTPLFKSSNIPV